MQRIETLPRPDWREKVENLGLTFHTTDGQAYWCESAYYAFTAQQVDQLEEDTNTLWEMCLKAVDFVIQHNRFQELAIPLRAIPMIRSSWEAETPSLYGRFDFAYDGVNPPKMLEFNADTPTSLLEAAVVQWHWLEELHQSQGADQFNSIWDKLVSKWKELKEGGHLLGPKVHFAHMPTTEDLMTVSVLRDTAEEAGIVTVGMEMSQIGWDTSPRRQYFVDMLGGEIKTLFKLYPWEWMVRDDFSRHLASIDTRIQVIEPAWKMILSNKGILPILWEMFPQHPNLLAAYFGRSHDLKYYAKKPLLSREGANVTLKTPQGLQRQGGVYGEEGYIYQELANIPDFGGNRPVIGSWVVTDHGACGIGVRESNSAITDDLSRFVPHLFF